MSMCLPLIVVPEVRFSWRVKRALGNLAIWDPEATKHILAALDPGYQAFLTLASLQKKA